MFKRFSERKEEKSQKELLERTHDFRIEALSNQDERHIRPGEDIYDDFTFGGFTSKDSISVILWESGFAGYTTLSYHVETGGTLPIPTWLETEIDDVYMIYEIKKVDFKNNQLVIFGPIDVR